MMFRDDLVNFQATHTDDEKKEKFYGLFGCANQESGTFSDQEADGILGLGLNTNSKELFIQPLLIRRI